MGSSHSHSGPDPNDVQRALNDANNAREAAQLAKDQAQREAERERREAQEARDWAQQDSLARMEADRMGREARKREQEALQREEEAKCAREEAERAARALEEAVAEAERGHKAADEARQAAEERLMRGIPPELKPTTEQTQQLRERRGYRFGKDSLNIALVGESGVGKSMLLNAFRGLWPDDPGAAAVGINETTAEVEGYLNPRRPEVKWFDVPGANTPNISGWLYFMDQGLYIFDILIILFSDRFTETVGTLLSNAHRCGIPTFLVRTKADQLVSSLKTDRRGRRLDNESARKILVEETRDMVEQNLVTLQLPLQPVFVVSASGMRGWVTEGDTTNVIDEQAIYQALFREPHCLMRHPFCQGHDSHSSF